ncbi:hypothetical protein ACFC26_09570 [Kitasatospora purpeofusca]|uniref:hypothetical protein n=1 Tax=Kitasatospora purpeofusca TaxID=67352 RepID=UPI0035E2146B
MATARQRLAELQLTDPTERAAALGAFETEVREQVAQEIDAAVARNLAEYPDIPAMGARRLGLAAAARIARDGAGEGR